MKSLVAGEMSFASLANSTQPQPSAPPPDPQNSSSPPPPNAVQSPPPPPNAVQSPPPPSNPTMASPPPKLPPLPPQPTVSPPSPATAPRPPPNPPPKSPPPPVTANSSPPPPVDPPNSPPPPPPSTNHPPPPPPAIKSPPPKLPASSPTPPPPPPANKSPPPPKSPESPTPPPPRQSPPPPPRNSSPPPPVLKSPPSPSARKSPSKTRPSVLPKGPNRSPSTESSSDIEITDTKFSKSEITVILVIVFGLLLLVIMVVACCLKRRKKASGRNGASIMPTSSHEYDPAFLKLRMSNPKNGSGSNIDILCSPGDPGGFGSSRSWFNYEELVQATDGFSDQNLLGEGGFGFVYKGILAGGREVAVKQLKIGGGQGDREFRSEVEIISRIHHRHLVTLVGYCIQESSRLLVYDYVLNNNLYFHLHGEGRPVLNWDARVKISVGAARGLAYLHEDCHPRIIHRDIKSSNILLDSNFEAQVSDFGLAKLALDAKTHVSTRVVGTFGYMAPEYASSGKLTESSDVYSFGVVLLELITGRKPVDNSQSLVEWARPLLNQALEARDVGRLADPRLESQYVESEMFRMIEAAAACVRHSFFKRPKMGQVVRALDIMANTDLTNGMRVGESNMFSPSTQSAEIRIFQRMAFGSQDDISTDFFDR